MPKNDEVKIKMKYNRFNYSNWLSASKLVKFYKNQKQCQENSTYWKNLSISETWNNQENKDEWRSNMLTTAVIFIMGINLVICKSTSPTNRFRTRVNLPQKRELVYSAPSSSNNEKGSTPALSIFHLHKGMKSDGSLSKKYYTVNISDFLSPDLFSQTDPVLYLLNKVMQLSSPNIQLIERDLEKFLKMNKIPSNYLPYANVLSKLIRCRCGLGRTKSYIQEIQEEEQESPNGFSVSQGILTPEVAELYSEDILSDANAPARLLIKFMHMPEQKIKELENQLNEVLIQDSHELSGWHYFYAKTVWIFLKNKMALPELRKSIFELPPLTDTSMTTNLS